jgi:superfamily II DNA or RNA helicase
MAHLHNLIQPRYILGLSATPFRADKVKLCFDSVLKDAGIQQLIQEGFLSQYHHYTIPVYTPKSVAETYLREPQRWGASILFFHTLAQCAEAQSLLRAGGVACEVVTGSSDREAQFTRFAVGECRVLINCMVLTEGFDYPALQTVFCRPSGKSTTIQMAGRVLRQYPTLPIKQVVQCQKTAWPFGRTANAAIAHTWQDNSWRSLTLNPLIHQVNLTALRALAKCDVQLPEYLQRRAKATTRPTHWQREDSAAGVGP